MAFDETGVWGASADVTGGSARGDDTARRSIVGIAQEPMTNRETTMVMINVGANA